MNINRTINGVLKRVNKEYHEASECIQCSPDKKIRKAIWTSREDIGNLDVPGLVQYYDGEKIMLLPFSHTLVTGSTGTGKSEVFYKNQVEICSMMPESIRPSIFITDVKGSLHEDLASTLEERGYKVIVYDMRNAYRTDKYNFLTQIFDQYTESEKIRKALASDTVKRTFDGERFSSVEIARAAAEAKMCALIDEVERLITEIAFIIVPLQPNAKEQTWTDGARTMFKAILWTMLKRSADEKNRMTRDKFTIANVCRIAFSTGDECDDIISWLRKAEDILCVQSAITSNYKLHAKATRDGYISTLNTCLGEYSARAIAAMTETTDDINLKEIAKGDKPYAIFIITDDRQKTTNNICMLFINNLLNELISTADSNPTHSLSRDFVILADEFANMPQLPNISSKITTLRSRKIWMVMAIQSLQQLEMVYGSENTAIIQDNCDIQMFLGCNNDETKERFAHSMGKKIGVKTSFNIANDSNISISKGTEDVPVVRKSDLDALELGEFYVRSRMSQNLKTYILPHFMQKKDGDAPGPRKRADFRKFDPNNNVYDICKVVRDERPTRRSFDFDF